MNKEMAHAGSMQDYNYIFHGTMEVTLEVSCCKYPLASALKQHWLDNKDVSLPNCARALFFFFNNCPTTTGTESVRARSAARR